MPEYGVEHYLVTPRGTIGFNAYGSENGYIIEDITGATGPDPRVAIYDRPGRDGAVIASSAPLRALYPVVRATLIASTVANRVGLAEDLKAALDAIREEDGYWRWTPAGGSERQYRVRLADAVDESGAAVKSIQFGLVASESIALSTTENEERTTALGSQGGSWGFTFAFPFTFGDNSSGGLITCTNAGNARTYPTIKVYGELEKARIENVTTGQYLEFETGYTIPSGDYVEIDMYAETVLYNGSAENNVVGRVNHAVSEFWALAVGANTVRLTSTQFDASARAVVTWRDAYQ